MTKAERELLEACAYALLNLGYHAKLRSDTLSAEQEIQGYLNQINRALTALAEEKDQ